MSKSVPFQFMMTPETREQLRLVAESQDRSAAWIVNKALAEWLSRNSLGFEAGSNTGPQYRRPKGRPRVGDTGDLTNPNFAIYRRYFEGKDRVTISEVLEIFEQKTGKKPVQFSEKAVERVLLAAGWKPWIEVGEDGSEMLVWLVSNP